MATMDHSRGHYPAQRSITWANTGGLLRDPPSCLPSAFSAEVSPWWEKRWEGLRSHCAGPQTPEEEERLDGWTNRRTDRWTVRADGWMGGWQGVQQLMIYLVASLISRPPHLLCKWRKAWWEPGEESTNVAAITYTENSQEGPYCEPHHPVSAPVVSSPQCWSDPSSEPVHPDRMNVSISMQVHFQFTA